MENVLKKKIEDYKPLESSTDESSGIPIAGTYLLLMREPEILNECKPIKV